MEQTVIRYWNKRLNLGMVDWRTVYLLDGEPILLKPEVYKGATWYTVYRELLKDSGIMIFVQAQLKRKL